MTNAWMIRAGEGGYLADKFAKGYVAIGWHQLGDLSKDQTVEDIRKKYFASRSEDKKGAANNAIAMIFKFRYGIKVGDWVLTYNGEKREYLLGKVMSEYLFDPKLVASEYPHARKVGWEHHISRDALKPSSKNSLGSTLGLFAVSEDVLADLLDVAGRPLESLPQASAQAEKEDWQQIKEDVVERAHELIKDKLLALSEEDMPRLVASILRAMGFKTRISPKGSDRGCDIIASPDGLSFQEPRIKVEVKHRSNTAMGAQDLRSFLGGLRAGDKGLYVSSGGFTKDSKYEADRANVPVTLIDLDGLANLVVEHYPHFDSEGQTLLPLVRIYWPNE
jgi:restriction system protein